MADDLKTIEDEARRRLSAAASVDELRAAEGDVLGKRSSLAALNQTLATLDADARKAFGREINEARARLTDLAGARRAELEDVERRARLERERLDLTEVLPGPTRGHLDLRTQTRDRLEDT